MCNSCHKYWESPCPRCEADYDREEEIIEDDDLLNYVELMRAEKELWIMETGGDDCRDVEYPEEEEE